MARSVLLVTLEGWGTNLVGTYGDALGPTPALDRLAAHGVVFDRCLAPGGGAAGLAAAWQAASPASARLRDDVDTLFMTDAAEALEWPIVEGFDEVIGLSEIEVDVEGETSEDETDWTRAPLAQAVMQAVTAWSEGAPEDGSELDATARGALVWLHLGGHARRWDAPRAWRDRLCDDEDPTPSPSTYPPCFEVDGRTDPDEVFSALCGAGAQASLLDGLVEWLVDYLESLPDQADWMMVVMGSSGYPLGEHHQVGPQRGSCYAEAVHVPLVIRPGAIELGWRVERLMPAGLVPMVWDRWLAGDDADAWDEALRKRLESVLAIAIDEADGRAIYTPRWTCVWPAIAGDAPGVVRLFLAPDDRWQQNDVADRAQEVVEAFESLRGIATGPSDQPLPDAITRAVR